MLQHMFTKNRREAFEKYSAAKLPSFKYAQTVGTNFGTLDLDKIDFGSCEENQGILEFNEKEVLDSGAIVCGIQLATLKYPEMIEKYLFSAAKNSQIQNKFTHLHKAFAEEGAFVYAPEGVELKVPVVFRSIMKGEYSGINILIVAEPNSKITFIDLAEGNGKGNNRLATRNVEIFASEGSVVKFVSCQDLGKNVINVANRNAIVSKDAVVEWFDTSVGSSIAKSDTSTYLNGPGATTKTNSLFFSSEQQHFDFSVNARHNVPGTISDILVKGALKNKAKAICRGTIKITEKAKNANGRENLHMLLLDEGTEADPIPILEIDTNDVKCSHSSSVGRIDNEKLFYLNSRGIDEKEAKKLIVEGFFAKIANSIPEENVRNSIEKKIKALLN